jgi:vacuolar-type H+-ATPase subunit I/STV1
LAIAKISHVAVVCPRSEIQAILTRIFEFGEFHPIDREGLIQDISLLILSSKAQAVYAEAAHKLPPDYSPSTVPSSTKLQTFNAKDPSELIEILSKDIAELQSDPAQKSHLGKDMRYEIEAVKEAALATFEGLNRIRFSYESKRTALLEGYVPTDQIENFRKIMGEFYLCDAPVTK